MFLYIDNFMYKISLESVQEKYKRTITEKLTPLFKGKLLENVVAEVMQNTVFNPVYDTNSVLIETRDGFRTLALSDSGVKLSGLIYKVDVLYPKYTGPKCEEIKECDYSMDILHGQEGKANPYFMKVANSFEVFEKSSEESSKQVEAIVNEYYTKKVASKIIKKLNKEITPKDMIFSVCVNDAENKSIQTVNSSFEIKTQSVSAEKIKEIIMETMPKFKAVSSVADEVVNRLFNYIMYGIDEKSRILPKPVKVANGKLVFRIKENGINFYFHSNTRRWLSEKLLVSTDELVWEKAEEGYETASYNGLKVSVAECNSNVSEQEYDTTIPFVAGKRLHSNQEEKYCNYIGNFPMNFGPSLYFPCDTTKPFKCYICLEL